MSDIVKIEKRLQNTEKALCAIVTVLEGLQPPDTQRSLEQIMSNYYDANESLGSTQQP